MHTIVGMQKVAWTLLIACALFAFLTGATGCRYLSTCKGEVLRTRAEIMEIAEASLRRFCLRYGIDRNEFGDPPILSLDEKEKIWVIDYQSTEHFVRFIVNNCGAIETSFGPPEKTTKVR
jgi:hypothetical protein